jgi:hypothetical protein
MLDTGKIFGRGETVHIVTPEYLDLPKLDLALEEGVEVKSGNFVNAAGQLATIGTTKSWFGLVMEGSHYGDPYNRQKPHKGIEAYFGMMGVDILKKVTDNGGTPFAAGDELSIVNGKLVHADAEHIAVAVVVKAESDYIRYTTI